MKKGLLFFLTAGLFFLWPSGVEAAKHRPPRGSTRTTAPARRTSSGTRGVKAQVRFRADHRALLINFSNFNNALSATYSLTYTSNGKTQGVRGTVLAETAGEQRELLFGTSSHGVCRYHTNISNARLIIDSKLSSGLIIRKPYRLRV